jgi:hypothetical protein
MAAGDNWPFTFEATSPLMRLIPRDSPLQLYFTKFGERQWLRILKDGQIVFQVDLGWKSVADIMDYEPTVIWKAKVESAVRQYVLCNRGFDGRLKPWFSDLTFEVKEKNLKVIPVSVAVDYDCVQYSYDLYEGNTLLERIPVELVRDRLRGGDRRVVRDIGNGVHFKMCSADLAPEDV